MYVVKTAFSEEVMCASLGGSHQIKGPWFWEQPRLGRWADFRAVVGLMLIQYGIWKSGRNFMRQRLWTEGKVKEFRENFLWGVYLHSWGLSGAGLGATAWSCISANKGSHFLFLPPIKYLQCTLSRSLKGLKSLSSACFWILFYYIK